MVGKLGDLKQVVGGPAHELAGAVLIVEREGQVLHMIEQVPADVRLDAYPHHVPPIGDHIVHPRPQGIGQQQHRHDGEERPEQVLGQQLVEGHPGGVGKGQVHQGDAQGAAHVQDEQLQMGLVVRQEEGKVPLFKSLLVHENDAPLSRSLFI